MSLAIVPVRGMELQTANQGVQTISVVVIVMTPYGTRCIPFPVVNLIPTHLPPSFIYPNFNSPSCKHTSPSHLRAIQSRTLATFFYAPTFFFIYFVFLIYHQPRRRFNSLDDQSRTPAHKIFDPRFPMFRPEFYLRRCN